VGKGKRADIYLEVRKRRGHIFFILSISNINCWYCGTGIYYRCAEQLVSIFLMDSDV
jgi:hypothetical protein